jgi:hypothetical protein
MPWVGYQIVRTGPRVGSEVARAGLPRPSCCLLAADNLHTETEKVPAGDGKRRRGCVVCVPARRRPGDNGHTAPRSKVGR